MESIRTGFRDLPAYLISEASRFIGVAPSTLRGWAFGNGESSPPLIQAPNFRPSVVSFYNLMELYVIAIIRRVYGVRMRYLRNHLGYIWKNNLSEPYADSFYERHPLLAFRVETDGVYLMMEINQNIVNTSRYGQHEMEFVRTHLNRIEIDYHGRPAMFTPGNESINEHNLIVINPNISYGLPVIRGTGIMTESVYDRYNGGESIQDLMEDYNRTDKEIEAAIQWEDGSRSTSVPVG